MEDYEITDVQNEALAWLADHRVSDSWRLIRELELAIQYLRDGEDK